MPLADLPAPRDQSIPARRSDLLDALIADDALASQADKARFRQLADVLALITHYEFYGQIEQLRAAYRDLDPERPAGTIDPAAYEASYTSLRDPLLTILHEAGFIEISHAEIARAHDERAELPVEVRASLDEFREVRFFRRGGHRAKLTVADWFGLRKRTIEAEVYDEVVLFVATRPEPSVQAAGGRPHKRRHRMRPGSVLLKSFHNIASADLNALFPNIRVVMSTFDRLVLTIPAIAGGVPILLNLASTVTVLFLVAGFYLGLVGAIKDDEMKTALAALSGLVALGGFIMRQWVSYQRRALMYHQQLTDNIYFRNVSNNAGLFDCLIGDAEEQACKEALLACFFLLSARTRLTQDALERGIEDWLKQRFGADIDFEVADALSNLERLGLLHRDGDALLIPSMHDMLARLERKWTEIFRGHSATA